MQSVERDFTFITKIDGLRQMRFRSGDQKRTKVIYRLKAKYITIANLQLKSK